MHLHCSIFIPFFDTAQSSLDAESKVEETASVDGFELLNKLFEDESMFKTAASRLIVSGSGGPFDYLRYPVGGIRPLETGMTSADLPRIVRYPSEDAEETAPQSTPFPNKVGQAKVDDSSASSATPSEKVKEFLSRVPDLSYMLSTRLTRPSNK